MLRFRRMRSLQKFVSVHSSVCNHFNQERHLYSRCNFKLKGRPQRLSARDFDRQVAEIQIRAAT